jgi:hypothetical protein
MCLKQSTSIGETEVAKIVNPPYLSFIWVSLTFLCRNTCKWLKQNQNKTFYCFTYWGDAFWQPLYKLWRQFPRWTLPTSSVPLYPSNFHKASQKFCHSSSGSYWLFDPTFVNW